MERGRRIKPEEIPEILEASSKIAIVGLSQKPDRDSHRIGRMLMDRGFEVIPVNPGYDEVLGVKSRPDLESVEESVDIVDVFRNKKHAVDVVRCAIRSHRDLVWFQLDTHTDEAVQLALDNGISVVVDHCIGVEVSKAGIRHLSESS